MSSMAIRTRMPRETSLGTPTGIRNMNRLNRLSRLTKMTRLPRLTSLDWLDRLPDRH